MIRPPRVVAARRWLLPVLALLLLVGHACELPAYAAVLSHADEGHAAHGHGHEHDAELWCAPLEALSSSTAGPAGDPGRGVAAALPAIRPAAVRPPAASPDRRARPPDRPPLFLLHAALLI